MNIKDQEKLYDILNSRKGYSIKICSHYVDSFVHNIDPNQDEQGREIYQYDSEVFSGRSLAEVSVSEVSVYKRVDNWQDIKL